ncbi:MAG: hypothetical protein ABJH52_07500 [Henriciella sp.]
MRNKFATASAALVLAGCSNTITLMDRQTGNVYETTIPATMSFSGTIEDFVIDSDSYNGRWAVVQQGGGSFSGFSSATVTSNGQTASGIGNTFGTVNSAQGNGTALFNAPGEKAIRCKFEWNTNSSSGQGICEGNDGKLYDMIVG